MAASAGSGLGMGTLAAGAAVAAVVGVVGYQIVFAPGPDPVPGDSPQAVASDPGPAADPVASPEITSDATTPEIAADPAAAPALVAPSFDLVRVDAAGGALIAGRAEGNAELRLRLDGQEIHLASSDAGGDFVAMFDIPPSELPRVLSLEMLMEDGSVLVSEQSVIISPTLRPVTPETGTAVAEAEASGPQLSPDSGVTELAMASTPDSPPATGAAPIAPSAPDLPESGDPLPDASESANAAPMPPADSDETEASGDETDPVLEIAAADPAAEAGQGLTRGLQPANAAGETETTDSGDDPIVSTDMAGADGPGTESADQGPATPQADPATPALVAEAGATVPDSGTMAESEGTDVPASAADALAASDDATALAEAVAGPEAPDAPQGAPALVADVPDGSGDAPAIGEVVMSDGGATVPSVPDDAPAASVVAMSDDGASVPSVDVDTQGATGDTLAVSDAVVNPAEPGDPDTAAPVIADAQGSAGDAPSVSDTVAQLATAEPEDALPIASDPQASTSGAASSDETELAMLDTGDSAPALVPDTQGASSTSADSSSEDAAGSQPEVTGGSAAETPDDGPALQAQTPTLLLADSQGIRVIQSGDEAPQVQSQVTLDTIAYDTVGDVVLAGRGPAESDVRFYLNNQPIHLAPINLQGGWRTALPQVDPGTYTLRLDEVSADGAVQSRIETPFLREEPEAVAAITSSSGENVITVQWGNTLWGIAQQHLGDGVAYVQIYQANRDQIRNPDLIYPGQIFTIPERDN